VDSVEAFTKSSSEGSLLTRGSQAPVGLTQVYVKGKPVSVLSVQLDGKNVIRFGRWLRIGVVQDEELIEGETVQDPVSFVECLRRTGLNVDIFTFAQKIPDITPRYSYHMEWDNLAVIPVRSAADWWENRAESSVRRAVRKAAKSGVIATVVEFDDDFVKGIVDINNETPIRQGKAFWHFQKSFDAVKRENSTYKDRNTFLGAYFQSELIGFIRLTYVDKTANVIQILCKKKHFDKRPANALIAKAVEVCEQQGISHLIYCNYVYNDPKSSLTEFKRRNGFEKVLVPRYYVPLTLKGTVALRMGFHRRLVERIPKFLVTHLLKIRSMWATHMLKDQEGSI